MPTQLIRFLVPGTSRRFRCGGLSVELQTARLVHGCCPTEVVTYRERRPDHGYLDDLLLKEGVRPDVLWIVSWGFDVPRLIRRLSGHRVAYHAHSSGYGFALPEGVPVLAVSRNTLGYWGDQAPRNPLFLVPNALEPQWIDRGARQSRQHRPIDVLVQARKSSDYVLTKVVPALRRQSLTVEIQSGWVDDLVGLFNQAKVVLYDSAEYWRGRGVSEGFGLPPLEAMACGCVVFTSLNHALADHCDPAGMVHQIGCGRLSWDVTRLVQAVAEPESWRPDAGRLEQLLLESGETALRQRWASALAALDGLEQSPGPWLHSAPTWQLRFRQGCQRLMRVVERLPGWPKG